MNSDAIRLVPLGVSRKRVDPLLTYGEKIARTSVLGKGSPIPIVAGVTSAYPSHFGADYHRVSVHRYQSEAFD